VPQRSKVTVVVSLPSVYLADPQPVISRVMEPVLVHDPVQEPCVGQLHVEDVQVTLLGENVHTFEVRLLTTLRVPPFNTRFSRKDDVMVRGVVVDVVWSNSEVEFKTNLRLMPPFA